LMIDKLAEKARKNSAVCVGLDTDYSYLPDYIRNADLSVANKIFAFNEAIINATGDLAACYKVQIAYYEALGLAGMEAYARTLAYLRSQGLLVIADVKRSDIASTAGKYAQGHFSGDFEADFVTLNPYMGYDSISPFESYLANGKGIFVLVRTSNPSASDFEELQVDGEPLYMAIAKKASQWGQAYIGDNGFTSIGAVVGINHTSEIALIKDAMPNAFFLIPGYGAQGGSGDMASPFFQDGICGVVNSSRGIICAHLKEHIDKGFEQAARKAVLEMREDLEKWL